MAEDDAHREPFVAGFVETEGASDGEFFELEQALVAHDRSAQGPPRDELVSDGLAAGVAQLVEQALRGRADFVDLAALIRGGGFYQREGFPDVAFGHLL